jgi:hypothetical protein
MSDWKNDIEGILEKIRQNSVILSEHHKKRYYHYKGYLKYFKLPLIVLSSVNSIVAVGLNSYLQQDTISLLTCLLSLSTAVIGSIEMYLGVQKNMEIELIASRNFKLLAYDIYKQMQLQPENRVLNAKLFLDEKYNEYIKLIENANLIHNDRIKDILTPLSEELNKMTITPKSSVDGSDDSQKFGLELSQLGDLNKV